MKKTFEYFEKSFNTIYSLIFYISLISIIFVILFIIDIIHSNYNENHIIVVQMLPALGITLSALLASTSLMKSIQNTNKIEKIKSHSISAWFKVT